MDGLNIVSVVGCRPNFIRIAPLVAEMKKRGGIHSILVHTGRHYERAMSVAFLRDLELPEPDMFLNVGSGSHARQTALIIQSFEGVLLDLHPDIVIVVGDVDSTVACSMTAIKLGFPVAHVEAGLRSFDREMPEEINRVLTDSMADLLFASERHAVKNLLREGVAREKIFHVGNVMVDALVMNAEKIARSNALERLGLVPRNYAVITLHRPSNVEDEKSLAQIAAALEQLQAEFSLVFPVHPRTASRLEKSKVWQRLVSLPKLQVVEPLGYIDFIKLMRESLFVMTDSRGVQEESTALRIPCLTLRENTELPVTITQGTNRLVGNDARRIVAEGMKIINGLIVRGRIPEKWDGAASKRIVDVLLKRKDEIKKLYESVRRRGICPDISSAA